MASNYYNNNNNTCSALNKIEAWRAAIRAQREWEDWEMEALVQEAQLLAEEEHRREEQRRVEEQRRIREQKQIAEEAEQKQRLEELWRVAQEEKEDDDDDEDEEEWRAGPSVPKKRKYDDKVSNHRNYMEKTKKLTT